MAAVILRLVLVFWLCRKAWRHGRGMPAKGRVGFWVGLGISTLVSGLVLCLAVMSEPRASEKQIVEGFLIGMVMMLTMVTLCGPVVWGIGRLMRKPRTEVEV
jgi:hypothetical protein